MSAFAEKEFKADNYNTFRPTYPLELYSAIFSYHKGSTGLCVDIGCGSGQASYSLAAYFDKVIGTDRSQAMIDTANSWITPELKGKIEFKQSAAESLQFLEDNSVDLVTVAEAIHWFNHEDFFKEVHRVLKPNGTLAYWGYADPVFGNEKADHLAEQFTYEDAEGLGPYWEQPGRQLLRNLFKDIDVPASIFGDIQVYENRPGISGDNDSPLKISKDVRLKDYGGYITTWSSYHNWKKQNPEKPDIAEKFIEKLQTELEWSLETPLTLRWITVLKLSRKL